MAGEHIHMREVEFLNFLEQVLPDILGARIIREPRIGDAHPDFMAVWPDTGREALIEAKRVTPSTRKRLNDAVEQLTRYAHLYAERYPSKPPPELVLAVPDTFSAQHVDFLKKSGVRRVIDGEAIHAAVGDEAFKGFMTGNVDSQPLSLRPATEKLLDRLAQIAPGRADWSAYQSLCGDILSFFALSAALSAYQRER